MAKRVFHFIFFYCFVLGGVCQALGILSYTASNALLLASSCFVIYKLGKFRLDWRLLPPGLFLAAFAASSFTNSVQIKLWAPYLIYIVTPTIVFYLIQHYFESHDPEEFIGTVLKICYIQFPVVILERLLYPVIEPLLPRVVDETDIGFGTFFMASDHVLGLFLILTIFTLLFYKTPKLSHLQYFLTIIYLVVTLFILNTKMSLLVLSLLFGIYLLWGFDFRKYALTVFIVGALSLVLLSSSISDIVSGNVKDLTDQLTSDIDPDHASSLYEQGMGNRFVALYVYADSPISWFGAGPSSTYDPYAKEFLLGGDFGQWLWLYNDLGLFGVLSALLLVLYLIHRSNKATLSKWYVIAAVLMYSFVFNSFIDVPFFFIVFYFSRLHSTLELRT